MNGKSPYIIIAEFCEREKIDKIIERILYHKYNEELTELINSYKTDNHAQDPLPDTIDGFSATLLSEINLRKNIRLAEEELEEIFKDKIKKVKRSISNTDFWKSVLASIVASFIFIIILILMYVVAENQVKSLINNGTKVESISKKNTQNN